jgi:hypothetical protein
MIGVEVSEPEGPVEPEGTCAQAVDLLALAAEREEQSTPSNEEIAAFVNLVKANPALALRLDLIAAYFDAVRLVAPPEDVLQPITGVTLRYTFGGLGNSVDYDLRLVASEDGAFEATGTALNTGWAVDETENTDLTPKPDKVSGTVEGEVVQALGPALSDLIPIETQFSSVGCWDYYPDWTVTLTFADGSELDVVTNESNVVGLGGPWQTEIDGQNYMQYSGAFGNAVAQVLEVLNLETGTTAAMGCGGVSEPLFQGYPREE